MQIAVVRPCELSAGQVEVWSQFQRRDPLLQNPFLSPHWAQAVERAQAQRQADPGVRVAVFGADDGFLAVRKGAFTAIPAGAPMVDYQGVVGRPGLDFDPQALVRALGVSRLDFDHMLPDPPAFKPHIRGGAASMIVDVAEGYAAFDRENRARSTVLKDIDRKRRKANREVGETRFEAFSSSRAAFDALLDWKRAQYLATGQTDIFATPWCMALIEDLFERRDPAFGAALYTLHIGDDLAAVHLHLHGGPVIHGWLIAHNPDLAVYSPGMLLFEDILKWMEGGPFSRLDLGTGDYRFKRELSNRSVIASYGFVGTPSPATLTRAAAYSLRGLAERLPLGRASALPGKAMRRLDLLRALR